MALLHSLQICGVRSFSPENRETIYFNTPVTLFLGQNGCGKTTIIESIRFALTSELPGGTSSGQGFINDPKLSNKTSTKASINIKFLDCQGNEITVSRFMNVSAKPGGGLTFKKLSVHIRRREKDDPGNAQDISGRCIDIDSYCCTALNVSKSILNNVLFCHQENSSWPLDEPKKLKEKFDEIFDAAKYTKCVDNLRKYIKDKQGNLNVLREKLSSKKLIKDEVERKRAKMIERKEKLQEIKEKIANKENEIKPKETRMQEILDLEVSLGTLQRQLTGKEAEKKGIVDQQRTIRSHISYEFQGSDEELQNKIESFQKEQEEEENCIRDLEKRKKEVVAKSSEFSNTIQKVQVKIGQLKEEQKQHYKKVEESKELVEKARDKLQINSSTDLGSSVMTIFELDNALKQSEEAYEELVKQKDQEEKQLQNEIDEARERFVSTKQEISSKNSLITESQNKIRDINYKLEELDTSDSQLKIKSFNENDKLREIEELKDSIQEKEKYLEKLEREYRILQKNYVIEQKLEGKKIESARTELKNNKKKVTDVCLGNPFNEVLNESYAKRERFQKDKGQYSSAVIMYGAFINKFERDSPCCPVCRTDFSNRTSVVKDIIQQLKAKIESIPNKLVEIERNLKNEEEFYNKLQQIKPINDNIEMLTSATIPLLGDELESLVQDHENSSMELISVQNEILTPQENVNICKSVITDVPLLDQYLSDINRSNNLIQGLEASIAKVPSNRSRQETEAEIDSVKAELSNIKNQYESNKMMLESHRERCQRLQTDIQTETQRQIDMQKLVQEKPLLEVQKEEYTEKLAKLIEEVQVLNDLSNSLSRELIKITEKKQSTTQANRRIKEEENNKIVTNKNMSNFRALIDNQTLREKQKLEAILDKEITDLKKNIGDFNYKTIYEEKQRIQKGIESFQREVSSLSGQKQEVVVQIREIEEDLDKTQNKNAYNIYKKQFYELRAHELAIQDLINYVNVLEISVLQFHKERMVQINRTIRELWRNIYRGNDIDYIEIQTDEAMTGGVNKRRSYNYKVVQVKNGIELEMRGRCSAGQKVLACLVIRMALAETFSTHCGILALDEPTTNLDRENIISLSDALSRIITAREREKNFQLLIITHDEEFLRTLTLDSYWKVSRSEDGFSMVKKEHSL
ncbi:hypothetical protein NQ317_019291 [Molorchus minor]|uniref:Zinc-hook domain-containing protein n=1 Tax=Molorchus minor TaxID=1323400 RepID=A0ABQ9J5Y9_9CUCU|nr:hypothetical protein NQ317_019291 [Molorchus minor]